MIWLVKCPFGCAVVTGLHAFKHAQYDGLRCLCTPTLTPTNRLLLKDQNWALSLHVKCAVCQTRQPQPNVGRTWRRPTTALCGRAVSTGVPTKAWLCSSTTDIQTRPAAAPATSRNFAMITNLRMVSKKSVGTEQTAFKRRAWAVWHFEYYLEYDHSNYAYFRIRALIWPRCVLAIVRGWMRDSLLTDCGYGYGAIIQRAAQASFFLHARRSSIHTD